jgi:hypothetical protein
MGVDLNYIGLNWGVIAADQPTRSGRVVAHGLWPGDRDLVPKGATPEGACVIFRRAIGEFCRTLVWLMRVDVAGEQKGLDAACFDLSMGKWQDAGMAAIRETRGPVALWGLKAFPASNYRPQRADLRSGKGWRITEWPGRGRALVINADYWRESMQRGFVVEPTEPGALSLYEGDKGEHRELAMQIAGEVLDEHIVTEKGTDFYRWHRTRGIPNDRADALVYARALTGVLGVGEERTRPTGSKRRRPTGVTVIPL